MWRLSVSPTWMHIPAAGSRGSWGLISLVMYTWSLRSLHTHTCAHTHTYTIWINHRRTMRRTMRCADCGGDKPAPGVCVCACVWNLSEEGVVCIEDGVYHALYNWNRHSQKLNRPYTPAQENYAYCVIMTCCWIWEHICSCSTRSCASLLLAHLMYMPTNWVMKGHGMLNVRMSQACLYIRHSRCPSVVYDIIIHKCITQRKRPRPVPPPSSSLSARLGGRVYRLNPVVQ
jgi:hypothetical protein